MSPPGESARGASLLARARASLTWQIGLALGVLALLLGTVFALLLAAIDSQRESADKARAAEDAVLAAADVERYTLDIQRGPRGFIITGQPRFLEPYREALEAYPTALERLTDTATTDTTAAMARRIAGRLRSFDRDYSQPLVAAARRDLEAAAEIVAVGEGKRRVDAIVAGLERLRAEEQRFVERSRADAEASADRAVAVAVGGLAVSACVVGALLWFLRRRVVDPVRRLAEAADRLAAGELAARTEEAGASELAAMSRAFNEMADSLEAAFAAAREAEAARDEFFALVSHELRTPLTSIVGYVELLDEDLQGASTLSAEERSRFLEVIKRNSRRLLRLVGDLLFVARLESGRVELARTRVDLERPVLDSVEAARPHASRARLRLAAEVSDSVVVEGDEGRIGQALDNLISNAIKFTPQGGEVAVRLRRNGASAIIEVADSGVGIPADEQQHLFDRFFRASTASKAEGIGLGLAITHAIAEGLDGRLEVESEPGEGSTFRIVLPLAKAER